MSKNRKRKTYGKIKPRVRTQKVILQDSPLTPHTFQKKFYCPLETVSHVTMHRAHYLNSIGLSPLAAFKANLWSGTALHLLELTHIISPSMHEVVDWYAQVTRRVIATPLSYRVSHLDSPWSAQDSKRVKAPISQTYPEKEEDFHTEKIWKDLSYIFMKHSIKNIVEELGQHNNLEMTKHLLRMDHQLKKLKEGLEEAVVYIRSLHGQNIEGKEKGASL